MPRDIAHRRKWVRWLWARGLSRDQIAATLGVPVETIHGDFSCPFRRPAADAWPFTERDPQRVRSRCLRAETGTKIRRLAALGFPPARIAEVLLLEPDAVRCFVRRTRRLRSRGAETGEAGELARPRTEKEERQARRRADAARKRRKRLASLAPPAGWTYADRSTGMEAAEHARYVAARDGGAPDPHPGRPGPGPCTASPQEPSALPEPAIWTGTDALFPGPAKLDSQQAAEIRELRSAGWSTGKLARKFGVTRATICNVLSGRTRYRAPCPALPIEPPSTGE